MVSDIRIQIWRDEFKAMPDDELRALAASGKARLRRLEILKLEIQERDRASEDAGKRDSMALAREANEIARNANTIAIKAERNAIVAAIAAVVSAIAAIVTAYAML